MEKKSRHRLDEMKHNEGKRKSDEVDTATHSRSAFDREDSGMYQGPTRPLQGGFEAFGPIFTITLLNRRAVVLIGPEYQHLLFTETDKKLSLHKTCRYLKAALEYERNKNQR